MVLYNRLKQASALADVSLWLKTIVLSNCAASQDRMFIAFLPRIERMDPGGSWDDVMEEAS